MSEFCFSFGFVVLLELATVSAGLGKPLFSMIEVKNAAEAFGVRFLSGSEKLT